MSRSIGIYWHHINCRVPDVDDQGGLGPHNLDRTNKKILYNFLLAYLNNGDGYFKSSLKWGDKISWLWSSNRAPLLNAKDELGILLPGAIRMPTFGMRPAYSTSTPTTHFLRP